MKTLFLLRHAKSSWGNPKLKDFERPLSGRGINDAPVIADRFLSRYSSVDCIICSPAMRAKSTAKLFAENINFPVDDIISNPELYFAGSSMFLIRDILVSPHRAAGRLFHAGPALPPVYPPATDSVSLNALKPDRSRTGRVRRPRRQPRSRNHGGP